MIARGTQVDTRGRPRPERVTSPARATTVVGPTWPPTSSYYIPGLYITDSVVPELYL